VVGCVHPRRLLELRRSRLAYHGELRGQSPSPEEDVVKIGAADKHMGWWLAELALRGFQGLLALPGAHPLAMAGVPDLRSRSGVCLAVTSTRDLQV
jgi:hypothetical protein